MRDDEVAVEAEMRKSIDALRARIATLRPVARAAVRLQQGDPCPPGYFLALSSAVNALAPEQREWIIKEEDHG
jgi:hypothetical protein